MKVVATTRHARSLDARSTARVRRERCEHCVHTFFSSHFATIQMKFDAFFMEFGGGCLQFPIEIWADLQRFSGSGDTKNTNASTLHPWVTPVILLLPCPARTTCVRVSCGSEESVFSVRVLLGCHTRLSTMIFPLHSPAPDSDMYVSDHSA